MPKIAERTSRPHSLPATDGHQISNSVILNSDNNGILGAAPEGGGLSEILNGTRDKSKHTPE